MAAPYGHKRSAVAGKVPSAGDFAVAGQILVNTKDGRAFVSEFTSNNVWTLPNTDDVASTYEARERLLNGTFDLWSRGTGPHVGTRYGADRWLLTAGAGSNNSVSRGTSTVTISNNWSAGEYTLEWSRSTAGTAESVLSQRIEDVRSVRPGKITVEVVSTASASTEYQIRLKQFFGTGGSAAVTTSSGYRGIGAGGGSHKTVLDLPSYLGKVIGPNSYLELEIVRRHTGTGPTATLRLHRVSLTEGDTTLVSRFLPPRDRILNTAMCRRYYQSGAVRLRFDAHKANQEMSIIVPYEPMRSTPTVTVTPVQSVNVLQHTLGVYTSVPNCLLYTAVGNAAGAVDSLLHYTLDDEL